jgi:hypothetical protein
MPIRLPSCTGWFHWRQTILDLLKPRNGNAFKALNPAWVPPSAGRIRDLLEGVYETFYVKVKEILDSSPWLNIIFNGSDDISNNRLFNVSVVQYNYRDLWLSTRQL